MPPCCDGRRATIPLLVVTSPQVKPDADRFGITSRIEAAGGLVLSGMCFYQSYAREMAEANGWQAPRHQRRPSWSTSSAATAIGRRCCRCRNASMRRAAGRIGVIKVFRAVAAMGERVRGRALVAQGWIFRTLRS